MSDRSAAILAAIESLPVLESERWRIVGALTMIECSVAVLSMRDLPNFQERGSVNASRRLADLAALLSEVAERIEELPAEAVEALTAARGAHPLQSQGTIRALAIAADAARAETAIKTVKAGAPKKHGAAGVADVGLLIYEALTGRRAAVRNDAYGDKAGQGPFVQFLADLFAAFDMTASAASQAKDAIARKKRSAISAG